MKPLRRAPALLATLALAACQSGQGAPPPPAPAAAALKAPTPPPPEKAPEVAPPAPPPAAPRAVLGYLQSPGHSEKCQWMRHPLPGEPTPVFSFNAACDRTQVSWSADGKQGLLFTWPSGEGELPRAWRVNVARKSGQSLELHPLPGSTGPFGPGTPSLLRLGFDPKGSPVALVSVPQGRRAPKKGTLTFEGEQFTVPAGRGRPGLALAYRQEAGGWKRIEAKASRFEAPGAPGLDVLDVTKTLSPVWTASLPEKAQGRKAPAEVADALDAATGDTPPEAWWMELPAPDGALYYRAREEGPDVVMGQPLFWSSGDDTRTALDDVAEPDAYLGFETRPGLLLVTAYGGYAGAHVWSTGKRPERLADLSDVYAPAFWPTP